MKLRPAAIGSAGALRGNGCRADNDAVPFPPRILGFALAVLCLALPAMSQTPVRTHTAAHAPAARVDINHGSVEELLKVPGMTRTWATRIVRFRPYHAKNDLLDRGVVPSAVYDRIKDFVIAHRDEQ